MSKIIIIENPISVKKAIKSFFLLLWLSGISSSTTTYIIAPAAKERRNGNKNLILITKSEPITAEIGSTNPLS